MKNKKKILTLIIILVLLIILAVGTCAVLYFTTDIFKIDALMSNDQLFAKYISQENSIANLLKADIIEEQKQFMKNNLKKLLLLGLKKKPSKFMILVKILKNTYLKFKALSYNLADRFPPYPM